MKTRIQKTKIGKQRTTPNRPVITKANLTNYLIDYEEGNLDQDQTIALFQHLENTGMAYSLHGAYGRTAMALIVADLIKPNMRYHSKESIQREKEHQRISAAFADFS
jgi:hypothetical protein